MQAVPIALWVVIMLVVLALLFDVGVLYLTLVPSTVQSSIAFTSLARGNVAGAGVSASVSTVEEVLAMGWGAPGVVCSPGAPRERRRTETLDSYAGMIPIRFSGFTSW